MFRNIRSIKVYKLLRICAMIHNLWYLVYNCFKKIIYFYIYIYLDLFYKYEYKYIQVDKKKQNKIQIPRFGLVFANTSTNKNIGPTLLQSN